MSAAGHISWEKMNWLVGQLKAKDTRVSRRMAFLIFLGSHIALRISDLLTVNWGDLVEDDAYGNLVASDTIVRTEKKTKKIREITLNKDCMEYALEMYKKEHFPSFDQSVFCGRTGETWSVRYVNAELKRINQRYSVTEDILSTHSLRKIFARHIWDKHGRDPGVLEMLSIVLNHSSTAMTRRYLGITKEDVKNVYLSV